MGERGRPPMPTALKLVARAKSNRVNHDEPQPEDGIPMCPSGDREVIDVWNYTMNQLLKMRVITMADRDTLHAYCEAVVLWRRAVKDVHRDGPTIVSGPNQMVRVNPAVSVMKEQAAAMKALGGLFGLSPAARTAIKVADQKPTTERGAGRLLTG